MARVLIVDDHYQRGASLYSVLLKNGYESALVPSIDAAMDMMNQKCTDVVMLADNLIDWGGQSRSYYRIIYPTLYVSQLSENDGRFFLKLGHHLNAKHEVAFSFSLN